MLTTTCAALLTRLIQLTLKDKINFNFVCNCGFASGVDMCNSLNYIESQIRSTVSMLSPLLLRRSIRHLNGQPQFISFCVYLTALCVGRPTSTSSNTFYFDANIEEKEWEKPTAYGQANLLPRLCSAFLDPIIMKGFGRPLVDADITNIMPRRIRTVYSYALISAAWDRHLQKRRNASKKTPSLL
ncbi:hypothetical protein BCR41DRAFT_371067 [Lobosporangium transversale]|uniref:Uncharacterized protein n=1 Tax=Lobosporangium transversale TaxID=64571 RepID=A0A1Y2GPC2_9FUNG|nr:hypothetical protein BCR41DRAFT_371067 [Lobosporangium transversale]ORZ14979.1 hypothetical protein BCR41DRAFT_371067 [Lobosporangium transversale]|eukprot:XP_021881111.1 hypothetical protein BCR41DRAFT_371067 [Lobosporangium transversale]